jgi:tungstate transport system ATP-binding protein
MDEPTSSVDPAATRLLERLTKDLVSDGIGVIWVSHDLEQVARIADDQVVAVGGRVTDTARAARYLAGHDPDREAASGGEGSREEHGQGDRTC